MKKIFSQALCLLALPAAASAQVELIAGWNFGQFISSIVPSTNGVTGDAVGFIPSNFTGDTRPPPGSSGPERINAGEASTYSLGSGVIRWDGLGGSDSWAFVDGTEVYVNNNPEEYSSINGRLVNANDMIAGQIANYQLQFNNLSAADDFAISLDTSGHLDFDPDSYAQENDYNFTFAAFGSGTVSFFFAGSPVGSSIAVTSTETAYNLNLPAGFYGNSTATLIARVNGSVNFDNIQINGVAIPEPSTYAAFAGLAGVAAVLVRRRR